MPDHLVVRTVAVDDPGDLVARLPHPGSVAWIRRGDGLAGWGQAARVTIAAGDDKFTARAKVLTELVAAANDHYDGGDPVYEPLTVCYLTFHPASAGPV